MTSKLVSVTADGARLLTPDGRPFFAVIANYVGHSDRAWAQFQAGKYDPALIEADFRLAASAGANAIRTFVAAPLQSEFPQGNWAKLDGLVAAARAAGVYLLLTLADYSLSYVATLAQHAGLIASHFAGEPAILAYDLKNEPRFYHISLMRFPGGNPLYMADLPKIYPPQRDAAAALAWARGAGAAPTSLSDADALQYANVSEVMDNFLAAAGAWIAARSYRVSVVEFIRSPEAAAWQPFLAALDAALKAWLGPQVNAIRGADPGRLITVGYSDPLLAALPANRALDLHAINRYPRDATPRQLEFQLTITSGLRATFPSQPVILTEFGYSTAEHEPALAAIYESAGWLRAYELGLAGAGKWMLWDLPPGPNPRERSFGLYDAAGSPKPAALSLPGLSQRLAGSRGPRGRVEITANPAGVNPASAIAYRYTADDALFASGNGRAGDAAVRWEGQGWGQIFADWAEPGAVCVRTTAAGQVTLDLEQVLGVEPAATDALAQPGAYTLTSGAASWPHSRAGAVIVFRTEPGRAVVLRLGLPRLDAQIVILWPHNDAPVAEATRANLTAHLTYPGTRMCIPCDLTPRVTLWRSLNNEPAAPVAAGVRRLADMNGRRVPVWDFNDVDVSPARDPRNKLYFTLRVDGYPAASNAWVHGVDARTYMPRPAQATSNQMVGSAPAELDARIQILWPHGGAGVAEADLANISVDLFRRGTLIRLVPATAGPRWTPVVWLLRALNNDPAERVGAGILRVEANGGATGGAHWDFNDVDVSPAREPSNKLHFWVEVENAATYSSFWTHGLDARTYLPHPDELLGDCSS
jgi:hypothetical protein